MPTRITRINPPELHVPPGYHHITVAEAGRTAHLAGQCPVGLNGHVVGLGDITAQIDQVVTNSVIVLAAVGATPSDVIRSVIYVVTHEVETLGAAWERLTTSLPA